jgi:septal ring factor EnvC (AmiA/AmiB activator)
MERRCSERRFRVVVAAILAASAVVHGAGPSREQAVPAAPAQAAQAAPAAPPQGAASDAVRTEALARRARARLEALQKEADALAAREHSLLGELRRSEVERQTREAELAQATAELASVQRELTANTAAADQLSARIAADRPAVEARLARLYRQGPLDSPLRWLEGNGLLETARAYRLLSAMSRIDRDRLAAYQRDVDALQNARASLAQRSRDAAEWQARAEAARDAARRAAAAQASLVASIDARRDLTARLAGELEQASARLQQTVAELGTSSPGTVAVLPLRPFQGAIDWPVPGPVTGAFGAPRAGTGSARSGIEIGAAEGTPARAVHEGRVAFADVFSGFGRLVIVEHGQGAFSLYGHLATLDVPLGARVEAGSIVGTTGRAPEGAPALYFELRVDGRPVDPLQWLKRR